MDKGRAGLALGIVLILVGAVAAGIMLAPGRTQQNERLKVVVTILPQKEFAERVGGDLVEVTVMVPPGESPHTYEPTPSQMQAVSHADLYFKVGSGVDFEVVWLDQLLAMNPDMLVVDGARNITLNGTDPHIWLSPPNAEIMVQNLRLGLETLDPEHAPRYRENEAAYDSDLEDLDGYARDVFSNVTRHSFMVYHPSWGYYAAEYGLEQIPVEEDGKDPTPQGLANLIQQAEAENITVIFVSPEFSTASAETIADQIGASVVYVDPLAGDYVDNLRAVTDALGEALA